MLRIAAIACVALALAGLAAAAEADTNAPVEQGQPPAEAASRPVPEAAPQLEAVTVTVVSVTGVAARRLATQADDKWEPLKADDRLSELTIIRTGLGARVVLDVAGRGRVTVRSATKVGIGELRVGGELMRARLGLKYGSMGVRVDTARGENDLEVATPVGTLAVRGTEGDIGFWGDMGLFLHGTRGTWRAAPSHGPRRSRRITAGQWTDGKLTPSAQLTGEWRDTETGDTYGGVTDTEAQKLRENGEGRGLIDLLSPSGGRVSRPRSREGDVDI